MVRRFFYNLLMKTLIFVGPASIAQNLPQWLSANQLSANVLRDYMPTTDKPKAIMFTQVKMVTQTDKSLQLQVLIEGHYESLNCQWVTSTNGECVQVNNCKRWDVINSKWDDAMPYSNMNSYICKNNLAKLEDFDVWADNTIKAKPSISSQMTLEEIKKYVRESGVPVTH